MSVKITDRFIAPSRGTVADVRAFWAHNPPARPDESLALIRRVYDLCAASGVDFALAVSRIADETGALNGPSFLVSDIWRERLNPGGIGVTDGDDEMIGFDSGAEAADAYMAHLFTYVIGNNYRILDVTPFDDLRYDDTPYSWRGSVKTLQDLTGKWFTNPNGAVNSANRGNRIFPGIDDQIEEELPPMADIVFGRVPHPDFQDRLITNKPEGVGWNDLGQRKPYGVVLHRMLGTLRGTDSFFRQPDVEALTDYGVGVAGPDSSADDGVIMRWADPRGRRSGWASGPVSAPYGDGLAFVNKFGINAVNRDLVSIEISGFQQTPLTAKARKSIVGLMAYWADQAEIPWDQYPIGPDGFSVVFWHDELTWGTGKRCPFEEVKEETPSLIAETQAELKKYQTKGVTPKPPTEPTYAPRITTGLTGKDTAIKRNVTVKTGEKDKDGKEIVETVEAIYDVFVLERPFEVKARTNRRQGPDSRAPKVGPALAVRETFDAAYYAVPRKQKDVNIPSSQYVLTSVGTWILASALTPRISIRKA